MNYTCVCKCSCDVGRDRSTESVICVEDDEIFIGDISGFTLAEISKMVKDVDIYPHEMPQLLISVEKAAKTYGRQDVVKHFKSCCHEHTILSKDAYYLPQGFSRRKTNHEEINKFWYQKCVCPCECGNRTVFLNYPDKMPD